VLAACYLNRLLITGGPPGAVSTPLGLVTRRKWYWAADRFTRLIAVGATGVNQLLVMGAKCEQGQ
jgi:hypothetical protein